ncbi:amino acid transport protein [Fructobacillus pseudoficulneus]|uniref:Amino acid transport protein n=1 Tax=Fructobacillus pseudoficulneus TaxID=220714 RepID=A0A3F3GU22_9LACO|nr:amino acid transport protein [Fructobacillus pseudoficulneus]SEH45422.1 amino acid/polyamine/organocation transporter, APC superfamily [Fructobacillus pseudoficulneus]
MADSNLNALQTEVNQDGTKRTLSNRHVQMMAIGGTIGTGLFLGAGSTISQTGPSIMLLYALLGLVFFFMMRAIGEMLYSQPDQHTFVGFITKYLGFGSGIFAGLTYWLALIFACMAELAAIATYVKFWFPSWNSAVIQLVFIAVLALLNVLAAKAFGETEFWFAMIKIIAIAALIVTGIFMVLTGFKSPSGTSASFSNVFHNFQMFPHGVHAFIGSIPLVFFSLAGMEFIGITIGETKSPRKVLKKAVNEIVYRILLFYIGALFVIMSITPWTSIVPNNSPFVQVFKLAGLPAAAAIINFVVLTSAASSLNSSIFSSGRHLYQIATELQGSAKPLTKIAKNGIPIRTILTTAVLLIIGPIISSFPAVTNAFQFVSGAASDLFLVVYTLTLFAHRQYRKSADFIESGFKMPFYSISSPLTIGAFVLVFLSLFTNSNDLIPALGAVAWIVVFGGICYFVFHKRTLGQSADPFLEP